MKTTQKFRRGASRRVIYSKPTQKSAAPLRAALNTVDPLRIPPRRFAPRNIQQAHSKIRVLVIVVWILSTPEYGSW
jgi:hypothetical protein